MNDEQLIKYLKDAIESCERDIDRSQTVVFKTFFRGRCEAMKEILELVNEKESSNIE